MEIGPDIIAILVAVAFVAGTVDALAGGGALLTLPALMAAGVPPVSAIAVSKLQSFAGTSWALWQYRRAGYVDFQRFAGAAAAALAGSISGAIAIQRLDPAFLIAGLPGLLLVMGLYFLLAPPPTETDRRARLGPVAFGLVAFAIGFYDGFFGPGTGSFLILAFVTLAGLRLVSAIGNTKFLNVTTNAGALIALIAGGHVLWSLGFAMAVASMAGNQVGARLAIRHEGRGVRYLLVAMSAALAIKLLIDPDGSL